MARCSRALRFPATLCARFGLEDVYVASIEAPPAKNGRKENLPLVARVAAMAALDIVEPGDRIGVAWGETIAAMAKAMPRAPMSDIEVCQLIGSKDSDRVPASEICAIEVANKLGANCFTLHAPGIVSSVELAEAFRSEPTIKAQLARLADLDLTIASVGNVADDTHLATAGMATPEALRAARQAGSVGIYCCRYIDENGNDMPLEPQNRIIAASIENLKAARKRLLVCLRRGPPAGNPCGDQRRAGHPSRRRPDTGSRTSRFGVTAGKVTMVGL